MIPEKNKTNFIILIFVLLVSKNVYTQDSDEIEYKFIQTDSSYTFYGSFKIKADAKCLLKISFDYEHIKALAPDAKEVKFLDQGNNWNQISYIYQKFIFFKNKTVWHRILNEEKQRVDFTLISSENNLTIIPRIISSSGYYQIRQQEQFVIVEYYQQCQLTEKLLTKLYVDQAKEEAIKFMHRFSQYANAFCNNSASNNK